MTEQTTTPVFRTYALQVLDAREREGVRGITSERNRFALHILRAPFAGLPLNDVRGSMIRGWLAEMQAKRANDTRGKRLLSCEPPERSS